MGRDKARRHDEWDDEEWNDEYYEPPVRARRPPQTRQRSPQMRQRPRPPQARAGARPAPTRRRSVWPWLLMGCAGGIVVLVLAAAVTVFIAVRSATGGSVVGIPGITNPTTYTQQGQPQPIPLAKITQMQVHDQIGSVNIAIDPTAATPTLTTLKKVKATNSDDANKEFNNISVQVQPVDTTLSVSATVPDTGSIFGNHNDSVDLTITLPPQSVSATTLTTSTSTTSVATTPFTLNVDISIGDVMVSGLNGVLSIKDDVGSIKVGRATLSNGSHLETGTGDVTFNGSLDTTGVINQASTTPRYKLQSETGTVDVTLPADTNIVLDANTNAGTITSDFPIDIKTSGGSASFYGPLIPSSNQGSAVAVLTLDVSSGSINIHKA